MSANFITHIGGYPRIGVKRELKQALEAFWNGKIPAADLDQSARELRLRHWREQAAAGLDFVAVNDFSLYDNMLDLACTLGVVPERFGSAENPVTLDRYFRMARGRSRVDASRPDVVALELTKWFDTNYHYLVPELEPGQQFRLAWDKAVQELREAREAGFKGKPVLIGPVTFLALSKVVGGAEDSLEFLGALLPVYRQLLDALAAEGAEWIEVSEPILTVRKDEAILAALEQAFMAFKGTAAKLLLSAPFGGLGAALPRIAALPIAGVHLDGVRGEADLAYVEHLPTDRVVSLGVIDGRSLWRADLEVLRDKVAAFRTTRPPGSVWLGTSCSLLHVPHEAAVESTIDPQLKSWFSFAKEKLGELAAVAAAQAPADAIVASREAAASRRAHAGTRIERVRAKVQAIDEAFVTRKLPLAERTVKQREALKLPLFPTTTIGSFPQTAEIRALRARFRKGIDDEAKYHAGLDTALRDVIRCQEELGLDVLVHGEFERTDMVEYFGEQLDGVAVTANGWVQSYGSRCVKPPVIWGDIVRPEAMTVQWSVRAQELTDKPMKGMLTGPITILQWSFVRDDVPRREVALQLALAIREEVGDLEAAGLKVIQVDEPGLREGLPLDPADHAAYLAWAVKAFRAATSGVDDLTQIHTHMCYAEFDDVAEAIAGLEADVISLEASRSRMEALDAVGGIGSEVGPGVWDIHSPRVPSVEEMSSLLRRAAAVIPAERLWVNPDCGLKTRGWEETRHSLRNLVAAARAVRSEHQLAATV